MERTLEYQTIESVRKVMMLQEEIFKQQVQELHRVYNLQKKLMQELENRPTIKLPKAKTSQTDTFNSMLSVWHQTATESGHSFQGFIARDDSKEASGSCSGDNVNISRMPIKFDFQMPAESTSIIHPSEDQKDLGMIDEEDDVEVELTLSIGHPMRNRRWKNEPNRVREHRGSSSRKKE